MVQPRRRFPPSPWALERAIHVYREQAARMYASLTEEEREVMRTDEKLRLDMTEGMLPDETTDIVADAARWAQEYHDLGKMAKERAKLSDERGDLLLGVSEKYLQLLLPVLQLLGGSLDFGDVAVRVDPGRTKVIVPDAKALPPEYQRIVPETIEADKRAIAAAWREKQTVKGAMPSNPEPFVVLK